MKATDLKAKFSQSMDKLITAIESDEVNADVEAFWRTMSRFHTYSLRNQILIAIQNPNASRVAGYATWQKMGRQVQAKEKGIRIFRPIHYHKTDSEYPPDDPRSIGLTFGVTSIFDISQTEGDDLPDLTAIDGSEHGDVLDRMMHYAHSQNITIEWCNTGTMKGSANIRDSLIKLSDKIDKNEAVGVLAHELAHIMIDQKDKTVAIQEYEAELSAYLFCDHFKIEIKTPHYLKSWGVERSDLMTALKAVSVFTGELISEVAA